MILGDYWWFGRGSRCGCLIIWRVYVEDSKAGHLGNAIFRCFWGLDRLNTTCILFWCDFVLFANMNFLISVPLFIIGSSSVWRTCRSAQYVHGT
jgi:hypothetical protein